MFKGRHFDRSVILLCIRWYPAHGLSLGELTEMMAERGIGVDHSTIHRWVVDFSPLLLKRFNKRKRAVSCKWHMDAARRFRRKAWPAMADQIAMSLMAARLTEKHSSHAMPRTDYGINPGAP